MAKLRFEIIGDTKSGDRAISGTQAKLKSIASTTLATSKQFAKYGSIATGVASAILIATTKQSLAQIDALAKTSDQMGITTEALATFQHLGELTGVSNEKMNSSLERMVKRLGEASKGQGAAKKTLEDLNLSAQELIQLSPDEQYRKIAEEIRGLNTASEKAAAVAAIFGREGVALLNTIEAGDEAFIAAARDAELFGTAVSRIEAAQVEAANDSFERVQEVLKGVSRTITVQLAPILQVISDRFVEGARESEGYSNTISTGIEKATKIVAFAADIVRGLEAAWKVAEIAVLGFTSLTLTAMDEVQTAVAAVADFIPGLEVKPSEALSEWANDSRLALLEANEELGRLVDAPMPSTNIEKFFDEVEAKSREVAEKVAETKKLIPSIGEGEAAKVDVETEKIIEAQRSKYAKLEQMAIEAQLNASEREALRHEQQLATIETDKRQLLALGVEEAEVKAMFDDAEMAEHVLHNQRLLAEDEKAAEQHLSLEQMSQEKRQSVIGDTVSNVSSILMAGNKKQFRAAQNLSAAQALTETYSGAQKAFSSLASIPIVGPALGGIAAAAAIVAGLNRVKQIKSQKYSQAHSGLDKVGSDSTFNLKRGEMVLDPGTSEEVRQQVTGKGGRGNSVVIENLNLIIQGIQGASGFDWKRTLEEEIKPGLDELFRRDIFLEGVTYNV